jgi:hypothetical protein
MLNLDSFLVSLYVLVDDWWKLECASQPPKTSRPALLSASGGGHHSGSPRSVASLPQREGLLALRPGAPALLLPYPLFAEPTQPAHPSPGAGDAPLAARLRPRARLSFGCLSRDGHDSRSGYREGEGFSQGAVLRSGVLREERFQDRVGLRLQGSFGGGPRRRNHRFRSGPCRLRRETHRRGPPGFRPLRSLPGRQGLHGRRVGAPLDGAIRSARRCDTQE